MKANRGPEIDPIWVFPSLLFLVWLFTGWWLRPIGDYGVETDFYGDFVVHARMWMSGEATIMNGFRGPFYYLLIGVLEKLFGDAFTVGKVLSSLTAAVSLFLIGKLLARMWGRVVALAGVLFVAANSIFVMYTFRACTDMVYLTLFVATLYFLVGTGDKYRHWMLAGMFAGFAVLTRYNGFSLVPSALLVAVVAVRPISVAIRRFASFAIVWFVVVAPWFGFLWKETGNPLWTNAFQNIAIDVFTSHPGLAANGQFMSQIGFASVGEVILVDPSRFVSALARNSVTHVWMDFRELAGIPWALAALVGAAMGLVLWRRARAGVAAADIDGAGLIQYRKKLSFILVGIVTYASFVPVFYNARFMVPLLPFWALGFGLLVDGLINFAKKPDAPPRPDKPATKKARRTKHSRPQSSRRKTKLRTRAFAEPAAAVVLVCLLIWAQHRAISKSTDPGSSLSCPVEILDIAAAAHKTGHRFGPDTPIAARKPHIGYYLGAPVVPIRIATMDEVGQAGAQYLLVTGMEVTWSPSLRRLMLAQDVPSDMEIVAHVVKPIDEERFEAGTLYKLPKSPLYEEPKPKQQEPDTIAGLDRFDTLRLKIVRWYHFFDTKQPSAPLLRAIEHQDHPEVLTAWGDLAFYEGDIIRAKQHYLRTLPDTTGQAGLAPPGTDNYLRMAAVTFLERDFPAFEVALNSYFRLKGVASPISSDVFWDLYSRLESSGDRVAALGLITAGYAFTPDAATMRRLYGKLLMVTGWHELGRPVLESYLAAVPNDVEITEMLNDPPIRRR